MATPSPNPYRSTVVAISVHRASENALYSALATTVRLEDEGGGLFLSLSQCATETQTLRMDLEELRTVLQAAEALCRGAAHDPA